MTYGSDREGFGIKGARIQYSKYKKEHLAPNFKVKQKPVKKMYEVTKVNGSPIGDYDKDGLCNLFTRSWETIRTHINKNKTLNLCYIKSK